VTLTISRASFPDDGADREALLRTADRRLHAVKDTRPSSSSGVVSPGGLGPAGALGAA
jgi:hypothetical protein